MTPCILVAFLVAACNDAQPSQLGLTIPLAVVCETINGYEDYVPREQPVLSRGEKLRVYARVEGATIRETPRGFRVSLTQDAFIRRVGSEGKPVFSKLNIVDFDQTQPDSPDGVYLENTIETKGLPPGHYWLEMELRDRLGGDPKPRATKKVEFQVLPPARTSREPR